MQQTTKSSAISIAGTQPSLSIQKWTKHAGQLLIQTTSYEQHSKQHHQLCHIKPIPEQLKKDASQEETLQILYNAAKSVTWQYQLKPNTSEQYPKKFFKTKPNCMGMAKWLQLSKNSISASLFNKIQTVIHSKIESTLKTKDCNQHQYNQAPFITIIFGYTPKTIPASLCSLNKKKKTR
jgi:hypothetical protein